MTENVKKHGIVDLFIHITEFIMAVIIILDCNSVYRVMRFGVSPLLLTIFGINICAGLLIILWVIRDNSNKECISRHKLLFIASFIFVFFFYFVNVSKTDTIGYWGYFMFFMNFMVILFNIYRKNNQTFRILFVMEQIMVVVAVTSIILWIGSSVLNLWGMNEDVFVDWGGKYYNSNYLNLCIRRWSEIYPCDVNKNLGIFCEPPMFGLMVGFSLYTEMFLKKKTNILVVLIFICAVLSSQAVFGIMVCAIAIFFKFVEMVEGKKYAKPLIGGLIAAALIVVGGLAIYKFGNEPNNFNTHIDDFKAAFQCWLKNPLLGCGYATPDPITQYMSSFRSDNQGLSNSILVVLAEGGVVLWLYYIIPFGILMVSFFKRNRKTAYWAVGMFCFWVGVVFHLRLLVFLILALGYSMVDLQQLEDENKKKKILFSIRWFEENNSDKSELFVKPLFNIPGTFQIVSVGVLGIVSVYALINCSSEEISSVVCSIIALIGIVVLIVLNRRNRKLFSYINYAIEAGVWMVFILIGNLYGVLDGLYSKTGLYIQDNWWPSIVLPIILYAIGCVIDLVLDNNRRYLKNNNT